MINPFRRKNAFFPHKTQASVSQAKRSAYSPQSTVHSLQSTAFTLIEVMLVIGIIAILATLLYSMIIGMRTSARQKQATAEAHTIVLALHQYRQEYGKWPAQVQAAQDTTYVTNNYRVIQPLIGFNPKNKIFLPLQTNNLDYAGNYLDPWGIPYVICMDENGDNCISNSYVGSYAAFYQPLGNTNISLTNDWVTNTIAGAASLGGGSNSLPWKSW